MDISIVIVNYNVKYFLEQCLYSVFKAAKGLSVEVFVVDNNSVDDSCDHIRRKFPHVILIENKKNLGFSKANNQAIKLCKGKYVLVLNPDTVLEEATLTKCFDFMESHPKAGALGVKMIDGKGNFLPESKRALPKPLVAFYKIFGLAALFPKSRTFGKYHLTYLSKDDVNKVEILAGAFMFMRKDVLDKIGYFDETFFMYGEDIDLSYRFIKEGYDNYYYPESTIIHYKGESTKKGSINYVLVFYQAMIIFARKHFSRKNQLFFTFFIRMAIYLRAFMAILKRFFSSLLLPVLDFSIMYVGFWLLQDYWERIRFENTDYYPREFLLFIVPVYLFILILSVYFAGGYEQPVKPPKTIKGLAFGTLTILLVYALLPESMRYSRALIILGAIWAMLTTFIVRALWYFAKLPFIKVQMREPVKNILVIANQKEAERITGLLKQVNVKKHITGVLVPNDEAKDGPVLGNLADYIKVHNVNEVIFSAEDLGSGYIIEKMLQLNHPAIDFKIAPPESFTIIGSNSIDAAGELYTIHVNSIGKKLNRNKKRTIDMLLATVFLLTFPIAVWWVKKKTSFFKNCLSVLAYKKTWISYALGTDMINSQLPGLRKGVLTPVNAFGNISIDKPMVDKLNIKYAQDYKMLNDLLIVIKGFKYLGNAY